MAYRAQLKVRFGDIDHAGIVYYPRFLHYFHVALEEFFSEQLGIPYPTMMNERRLGFPSVHLEIDFHRPLRFGDRIEVEVHVEHLGTTSIRWLYHVYKNGEAARVATGRITTVGLNMDTFEKTPVPDWLRSLLESYERRAAAPPEG
jgi:4-hydroxybenzoyl-CoA thioesterase